MTDVLAGAEPSFYEGGPIGIVCVHGFGGTPYTLRPVALELAERGYTVSVPRLPGHGTSAADMATTGWTDWLSEVDRATAEVADCCERVFLVGLSMGATLSLAAGASRSDLAGLVVINPLLDIDPDMIEQVKMFLDSGAVETDDGPSDISDSTVVEIGYDTVPLASLLELYTGAAATLATLDQVKAQTLVITSRNDHVVPTDNSELVVKALGKQADQLWLERSFHVATLDVEHTVISDSVNDFIAKICNAPAN